MRYKQISMITVLLAFTACSSTDFSSSAQRQKNSEANGAIETEKNPDGVADNSANEDPSEGPDNGENDSNGPGGSEAGNEASDDDTREDGDTGSDDNKDETPPLTGEDDVKIEDGCINISGSTNNAGGQQSAGNRTTFYFGNKAVDPSKSGSDPAKEPRFGFTPYPISPAATLETTTFELTPAFLRRFVKNTTQHHLEVTAFAHQFGNGMDRVQISFEGAQKFSAQSIPNIYSSYGYINIANIKLVGQVVRGDIEMHAFGHGDGGASLGIKSLQDATNLLHQVANVVPASVIQKNVKLDNAVIRVRLDATKYDSVQYRAVRGNYWGKNSEALAKPCN